MPLAWKIKPRTRANGSPNSNPVSIVLAVEIVAPSARCSREVKQVGRQRKGRDEGRLSRLGKAQHKGCLKGGSILLYIRSHLLQFPWNRTISSLFNGHKATVLPGRVGVCFWLESLSKNQLSTHSLSTSLHLSYCPTLKTLTTTANMAYDLGGVNPSDVVFFEKLKESKNSVVFKVAVCGKTCVMKVVST